LTPTARRMMKSKRLHLPTPKTCVKYSVEAAKNARDLRAVAAEAVRLGHFGTAVSVEILALEEAAKAQALGMRAIFASLHPSIQVPVKGLEDVLQRRHGIRYRFAAWQIVQRRLVELSGETTGREVTMLEATTAVAKQLRWLRKADRLRERGFYVDPHSGKSPSEMTRDDYDEAAAITEPYVSVTLEQAGLVPPKTPEARSRRISLGR